MAKSILLPFKQLAIGLLALIALLFACTAYPTIAFAASDTTAPTVTSVKLERTSVTQGGEVKANLSFVENGVGLVHIHVHFRYINEDGSAGDEAFTLQQQYYDNRKFTGTLSVSDQYIERAIVGTYFIDEIYTRDYNDNIRIYSRAAPDEALCDPSGNKVNATNTNLTILRGTDTTAPKLTEIGVYYTNKKDGLIGFSFKAVEDGSGVAKVNACLDSKANITENANLRPCYDLVDRYTDPQIGFKSGSYTSTATGEGGALFGRPSYDGEYYFREVTVTDVQGNSTTYHIDHKGSSYTQLVSPSGDILKIKSTITVGTGPFDNEPPTIKSVSVLTDKVTRPGVAVVRIEVKENDCVDTLQINFVNETGDCIDRIMSMSKNMATGTYDIEIGIDENLPAGTYHISYCDISDRAGNRLYYDRDGYANSQPAGSDLADNILGTANGAYLLTTSGTITIFEEDLPISIESAIGNPNLVTAIEEMENSGVAHINITPTGQQPIIPASLFEAIDNTNKTLWFYGQGVDWVFNGLTIGSNQIKDVNPSLGISVVDGGRYGFQRDVIKLDFANNGTLPGPAIIRLKVDYLTYLYGLDELHLYYVGASGLEWQDATFSLKPDDYIEFPVYHNSTYVIGGEMIDVCKRFSDLKASDWWVSQGWIDYVVQVGLMNGMSETKFSPKTTVTRSQVATTLYRMAGSPTDIGGATPFTDEGVDSWAQKAIRWAYNNGIVNGKSATAFKPRDTITREELATMIYRYCVEYENISPTFTSVSSAPDGSKVSSWARAGIEFCLAYEIMSGDGRGNITPRGNAQRCHLAKMLTVTHMLVYGAEE